MSTWLITGCSSGIGRALARAVLEAGHRAVVTARDTSTIADLADAYPDAALAVALDVTDTDQIRAAVEKAIQQFGQIDVLVNNAGYGYRSAVEEGDDADIARLFATNLFGPVHLIQAVLPGMRERRAGTIVNVSSIGARVFVPGSGYYGASKAALEAVSGALRHELAPLGIAVIVVEPGAFRTDFYGRSLQQPPQALPDYADTAGRRRLENSPDLGNQPGDPAKAGPAIIAAVESPEPPILLHLGSDAVRIFRAELDTRAKESVAWEQLSGAPTPTT